MNPSILFTVGTPLGQWSVWAETLLSGQAHGQPLAIPAFHAWLDTALADDDRRLGHSTETRHQALAAVAPIGSGTWGAVDGRACWVLDTLSRQFAQAHFLVLIESPVVGLAAALASGSAQDPALWLSQWVDGAKCLRRHLQQAPQQCLVVDAGEACARPQALAEALSDRFGLTLDVFTDAGTADLAGDTDALCVALASALTLSHATAQALHLELQASCVLLPGDPGGAVAAEAVAGQLLDGAAAASRLRSLHAALREADAALGAQQQAIQELELRLAGLSSRARAGEEALRSELAERTSALETLERALGAAGDQNDLLGQQLQLLQQELGGSHAARVRADERADALAADLNVRNEESRQRQQAEHEATRQLEAQAEQFRLQRDAALASGERAGEQLSRAQSELRREQDQARQSREASGAQLDGMRQRLQAAKQQNELMLQQFRQQQQELAQAQVLGQELARSLASCNGPSGLPDLVIEDLWPALSRDAPPFRELSFDLRRVKVSERSLAEVTIRLVEHHGHPGLVVFACDDGQTLLREWRESGREDDRPYMLLVPADEAGRLALAAMDSVDWQVVLALVARVQRRLHDLAAELGGPWLQMARRLGEQLQELPHRFRCASVEVVPMADAKHPTLAVSFRQVHCGARQLPALAVHWCTAGEQAGLSLQWDGQGGPPLTEWSDDEHGRPITGLHLPLPAGEPTPAHRQPWQSLSTGDRTFVLAMLAEWPQAGIAAPQSHTLHAMASRLVDAPPAPVGALHRLAQRLRSGKRRGAEG